MSKNTAKFGIYSLAFILLGTNAISPAMASISAAFPDAAASTVQLILLIPQLMSAPFIIFGGFIAGFFSKKKLSLFGLALFSLGGITGFFVRSLPVIIVSRCFFGIGYGFLVPCSLGLASDIFFGTEEYDHIVGMEYSLKSIGSVGYSLIAGILCTISWQHTFLVYLSGVIVFFIILIVLPDIPPERKLGERTHKKEERVEKTKHKIPSILIPCILIAFIYSFFVQINTSNISYLVEDNSFGTSAVSGVMSALCTVGAAIGAAAYDKILQKTGRFTLLLGMAFCIIGLYFGAFATGIVMVVVCVLFDGFGLGMVNPALLMLVGKDDKKASTLYFSLVMAFMNVGSMLQGVIVPRFSAWIFGGSGVGKSAYFVGATGMVLVFVLAVLMILKFTHRSSETV